MNSKVGRHLDFREELCLRTWKAEELSLCASAFSLLAGRLSLVLKTIWWNLATLNLHLIVLVKQTDWSGLLGSNSKFLGDLKNIIGSALLGILALFQWAMTREYAHTLEVWAGEPPFPHQLPLRVDYRSSSQRRGEITGNLADTPKDINHNYLHKWGSAHFPPQMDFWENNKC